MVLATFDDDDDDDDNDDDDDRIPLVRSFERCRVLKGLLNEAN